MAPVFVLPDQLIRKDGSGPVIDLGEARPETLHITLGITSVIEQESLDLAIYGSTDGETWGEKPILAFPQKFYTGVYSLILDLADNKDVRYLKAGWKLSRWGRGGPEPMFGLYVVAEPAAENMMKSTAG